MRYSDWEQREMDAKSFAEDDKRRTSPIPVARPRLPTVTVPDDTDLDNEIEGALSDALSNSEGRANAWYLRHALAQHGLVIVETSKWGSAKAALMVIGSCGALDGKPAVTALELAADVARRELKKMEA